MPTIVAKRCSDAKPPGSNREYDQLKLLQVNSSGASASMDVYDWEGGSDDITDPGVSMITNADQGVLLTWSGGAGGMAVTAGASVSLVSKPQVPGGGQVFPVLQAQDGSFVGVTEDPDTYNNDMVAFDASGNVRWIVPNETPQIATADGGVIGQSGITYDQYGNATGMISLSAQSWIGNVYPQASSVENVAGPWGFEADASFWPTLGGNPSGNGTAIVQCPCLLQSTDPAPEPAATGAGAASALVAQGINLSASQRAYLIMAGDPGRNWGPDHNWNQGQLFNLAATTLELSLTQSGNGVADTRVSSFSDFSTALTANGLIDGGVTYFGHGGQDRHGNMALFPGQDAGDANNVSILNVGGLSNANLGPNAVITLNACHAGYAATAGRSIAQVIANQLKRTVLAYPVDMYFSSSPTPRRFQAGMVSPSAMPVYMVPNGDGMQPTAFRPH